MSDFTLRKANNFVEAEGYLDSVKLEEKVIPYKNKKTNEDATIEKVQGEIVVEVNEITKVKFRVDVNRYKVDGTQSKVYDKVMAIKNDYVSKAQSATLGRPADRVRVRGSFDHRDHLNADKTELWSYGVYNFSFSERVDELKFKPHTRFEVEMYIESIEDEKKDDVPTGAVFVNGIVPLFNRVIPLKLRYGMTKTPTGEDFDLGAYVKENFSVGKTFEAYGEIVGEIRTTTTNKQTVLGGQQTFETISVKPVVTDISPLYLITDPKHFDKDSIKAAMNARQEMLDKIKEKMVNNNNTGVVSGAGTGSNGTPPVANTQRELNW